MIDWKTAKELRRRLGVLDEAVKSDASMPRTSCTIQVQDLVCWIDGNAEAEPRPLRLIDYGLGEKSRRSSPDCPEANVGANVQALVDAGAEYVYVYGRYTKP